MRRVKWIERLKKVSLALVVAVALSLILELSNFPVSFVKYGRNDIPVRGKFVLGDMGLCIVEPFTRSGHNLPKGFRPSGYVTVIPDTFPEDRLFGSFTRCGDLSLSKVCVLIEPCYYIKYPDQLGVTIIFHPDPYIQDLWKGILNLIP